MKILVTILTHEGTHENAVACLDTWIGDIQSPHEYRFYGDSLQSKTMVNTWNCEPDDGEARFRLPEKTYKMLIESLNHDWDFLFKCDDDTYLNFDKLVEFLKDYDANDDLYLGGKIVNPFAYAQGGAGYILTRSAVKKCIDSLKYFYDDESKNKRAEDYSVGLALKEQGVNLTHANLISTPDPAIAKQNQSVCIDAIIKEHKITTHYVNSETMEKIYDIFKT